MNIIRNNSRVCHRLGCCKYFSTIIRHEEEYTASPNYPPIQDLSYHKKKEREKDSLYEEIKAVKTVEEKQIKLNMPRYYGYKTYMLLENKSHYNNLTLSQHVTRTHLNINNSLPEFYNGINVDNVANAIKSDIEDAIAVETDGYQKLHDLKNEEVKQSHIEDEISSSLSKQINRIIINELSSTHPHLNELELDIDPRIESTWCVGGIKPPDYVVKPREGVKWQKDMVNDPFDRHMAYTGCPSFTLRSEIPLRPIVPVTEAENPEFNVPEFPYDPRTVGVSSEQRHIVNVPGVWPGDTSRFAFLSFHKRGYLHDREDYKDVQDNKEVIHRQGILASFGWLQAQANFLGFNTYNDLTYPIVTQTVVTNGKLWSFYAYQLNTIVFCERYYTENPKRNICWGTPELQLFDSVVDGKVIGFNEEVLKNLLKFYLNEPQLGLGVELTPYLRAEEKITADYEDDKKREWLENNYKHLMANRPRHLLGYEIYAWEKIYKIDNKTRFMDKRLRPFELFQNPYKRKLNDRPKIYVPKKFREHLPKRQGKFADDYWP